MILICCSLKTSPNLFIILFILFLSLLIFTIFISSSIHSNPLFWHCASLRRMFSDNRVDVTIPNLKILIKSLEKRFFTHHGPVVVLIEQHLLVFWVRFVVGEQILSGVMRSCRQFVFGIKLTWFADHLSRMKNAFHLREMVFRFYIKRRIKITTSG